MSTLEPPSDNNNYNHLSPEMLAKLPLHIQLAVIKYSKQYEQMSREQLIEHCQFLLVNQLTMEEYYKGYIQTLFKDSGQFPFYSNVIS
jgi:hypothetical protein